MNDSFQAARQQGVFEPYPRTDDGYCVSYDPIAERDEWLAALERHGVVVLRVLEREQCERTLAAFWREANEHTPRARATLDPNDLNYV